MTPPSPLRILELFAGYNGLGMAIESALGGTPVGFAEFDAAPSRILAHHYPDVPNYHDVTAIKWDELIGLVDAISGGSPCQDVSAAGRRAGMLDGTRSGLWASMREGIATIRPRFVVWENVRGALTAKASSLTDPDGTKGTLRALGRVLGDLASLGYDAEWRLVKASDVGAAHQRARVFVLAWDRAQEAAAPLEVGTVAAEWSEELDQWLGVDKLPTDGAVRSGQLAVRPKWASARAAGLLPTPRTSDTNGPGIHGSGGLDLRTAVTLLPTPESSDATGGRVASELGGVRPSGAKRAVTIATAVHHAPSTGEGPWGQYGPAVARWETILGRPAPKATAPTGRGGAERLAPEFVEWLMGLPERHVTDPALWADLKPAAARNAMLKALGNGVVPAQAEAALRDMASVLIVDAEVVEELPEVDAAVERILDDATTSADRLRAYLEGHGPLRDEDLVAAIEALRALDRVRLAVSHA